METQELKCTMCRGPFHPATGHWVSETRHWCGACTRGMIKMLKEQLPRRWGGLRFYDHIAPLPAEAPAGFRPADVL